MSRSFCAIKHNFIAQTAILLKITKTVFEVVFAFAATFIAQTVHLADAVLSVEAVLMAAKRGAEAAHHRGTVQTGALLPRIAVIVVAVLIRIGRVVR